MAVVAVLLFVLLLIARSGAFSSSSASATTHRITKSPHISNAIHRRSDNDGRRERRRWLDETNDDESFGMLDGDNFQAVSISRRRRLAIVSAFASTYLLLVSVGGSTASAAPPTIIDLNDDDDREFVRGRVTLQSPSLLNDIITSSVSEKTNESSYALYVTARPSIPDNVPTAILDGSRGKSPPVLSARYPNPTFPFDFALTAKDFTTEGAAKIVNGDSASDKRSGVWWSGQDLIVSARLDTDGIASTRGSDGPCWERYFPCTKFYYFECNV
jgi:hypothetical protein